MNPGFRLALRIARLATFIAVVGLAPAVRCGAQPYLDNQTLYSNQDPNTETRRSDHFRMNFGHYNRDTGMGGMTEAMAQGNLQEYEQMWNRWVVEIGLHDVNESVTKPDGNKYRANFNFLMTWNDGGGGGAYSSMDGNGFFYAMANPGYCRWDPPSGATPHEFGHVWEGSCGGFNGSDSSGAWWECTANWMLLQFLNTYPQAGGYLANGMYYPAHGRDYYDSWVIWEAAHDAPRYGAQWVNSVWTNWTPDQQVHEYILDRMVRCDTSGSADKAGAMRDLWGDMTKKMVTWDFQRKPWLAQANSADDGSDWGFYQRCRTPLVRIVAAPGWYRPERSHTPMEYGFNIIPLVATPGATLSCNFQPDCDPVRQSDWRACLVAVTGDGHARYSPLWNKGTQSMTLSADENRLYLTVIATPKPMKIVDPVWNAYQTDAGLQFPYRVAFTGAAPANVVYPAQNRSGMHQHPNGLGWVANLAVVDATAYVGPKAQVLDSAQVLGSARVEDYAVVRNSAQVRDSAIVSGHAMVQDTAQVFGNAKVRDWARVFGNAQVYGNAKVIEHANCGDTGNVISDNAIIKGTAYVYSPSSFSGTFIMDGDSANGGTASSGVHFGWQWGQNSAVFGQLTNNYAMYVQHTFERDNAVFACDNAGINHGFLINGCRSAVDVGASLRGGWVLPLNGTNQFVELHNSVNDFKDTAITLWVKWAGGTTDQRIWSMGDGAGKAMYLTPKDGTTGGLRFVITDGITTQSLDGAPFPVGTWTHVAVVYSGATATLYVNGAAVASNASMVLFPDSLNAPLMENANYLGRGNAGNYFQGSLDDFRVYMTTLSAAQVQAIYNIPAPAPVTPVVDTTAPTPNPATWLVSPIAVSDSAVTMSAAPGTDASGWVEYYFACTSGAGHDSGWVSFNKYTDVGLTLGATYTYTVQMRDRNGNTTAASPAATAVTPVSTAGIPRFAYGPVGIAAGQITMTANAATNASGRTEYKFDRSGKSSGWLASPAWTDTGLAVGSSYTYTVTVRDGRGNTSPPSAGASARARDDAAPLLPIAVAHWAMQPYPTITNTISMTAQSASDPSGIQYYFHCAAGGAPDSGWQDSPTYVTAALGDGAYSLQYKLRDKSAQTNESDYSTLYTATIKPTTGYHPCAFAQLTTLPDDNLVTFTGRVVAVNASSYLVQDPAGTATIPVWPSTYAQATDLSLAFKTVSVSGHLYTYTNSGGRLVSYATLTSVGSAAFSISGTVTDSTGAGLAGITVYFSATPNASTSPAGTTITDVNGRYTMPIVNGTWFVCAGSSNYITSLDRTVLMNSANVTNINFNLSVKPQVSGTVTDLSGAPIAGANVWLSLTPDAGANPLYTATTDAAGRYSQVVSGATLYLAAGAGGYLVSADRQVSATGMVANVDFALARPVPRNVPQPGRLLFSCVSDSLPLSGVITAWPTYLPAGQNLTVMGSPVAQVLAGKRWAKNNRITSNDGYLQGQYAAAIPCSGVSIVAAVKPVYCTPGGENRGEIVDIFYDELCLAISHPDGRIMVSRNNTWGNYGPAIPNGQTTILSLIVQPDGSYKVYTNGVQAMAIGPDTSAYKNNWSAGMVPGGSGSGDAAFKHYVDVGRNNPDGWSAFNGYLGDVFVYTNALADADRQALEADLSLRFSATGTRTIMASAGPGGSLVPDGVVTVVSGSNQTFTVAAEPAYQLTDVQVDGVSQGPVSSYTFISVATNHTISATFAPITHIITAAAGAHGMINPAGDVPVVEGSAQTFNFTPDPGYMVDTVVVDGTPVGRFNAYAFTNVLGDHSIQVSFKTSVAYTITATAGPNGALSPSGVVQVLEGWSQAFTVTPNARYAVSNLVVDGVSVGNRASYTFTNVVANHTIAASFSYTGRNIPATDALLFSAVTDTFPASGNTGNWASFIPAGQTLAAMGTPTVEILGGVKWEKNVADGPGYRLGTYAAPIPANGASIVVAAKPKRVPSNNWDSIVDIFYDRLVFGLRNDTGVVNVRRNGSLDFSTTAIPDGQATILSLVVQPDGQYKVWANGALIYANTTTSPMTALTNGVAGGYANSINVGRNDPDGWTTFNGDIGDVFVYKIALSDADRQQLEADLTAKFLTPKFTITAAANAGGSVDPSGSVLVNSGASQTFTFTALPGDALTNVMVDGVWQGAVTTYTFSNVTTNHTLNATFAPGPIPRPALSITLNADGSADLAWPDTYAGALISSPGLGDAANWSPVGIQPAHAGNRFMVTVAPGTGPMFYALSP